MIDPQSDYKIAPLTEEPLDAKLATEQALMYARDLTWAIRQKREKQAALERLRQTFLSTINHEMRTPLSLIFQTLEMLETRHLGRMTEEQLDAMMVLRRQMWTLSQMIDALTRVAAFLSKQETITLVRDRLQRVFDNVLPLAEFKARSKEIVIETDIAPNLPMLPLDAKQMEEALTQLLDNAIKFNHHAGKIQLTAYANDNWVIIKVLDTGIGIDPQQMDVLWEIFEQSADPLRRAQEGLGLGLGLARYIIEAHHGKIEVETVVGQGSTFIIKLPIKPPKVNHTLEKDLKPWTTATSSTGG